MISMYQNLILYETNYLISLTHLGKVTALLLIIFIKVISLFCKTWFGQYG